MHRHPASKLLHGALYITINRKNEQVKTHNWLKYVFFFFLQYIRMSGKNINFGDRKIKKATFIKTKRQIRLKTLMLIIYQFLKKDHTVRKTRLNTLSAIMIMISLDLYV